MVASDFSQRPGGARWQVKPTSLINTWLIHNRDLHEAAHKAARTGPGRLRRVVEDAVLGDGSDPGPESRLLTWALTYVDYCRLAKVLEKE
jgi:hypothetical protein